MESTHRSRLRVAAVMAVLTAAALGGCGGAGGSGSGSAPSAERARELIRTALDAWKGGKAAGLERREPPIRFVDPDLSGGATLVGYEIAEGEDRSTGPVVDIPVDLRLKDRKGRALSARAVYQVATDPILAVLRNDPD